MAIRQIESAGDLKLMSQYAVIDPFQLASPCWMVRVLPQLPPAPPIQTVTLEYIKEKEKRMAIKTVPVANAPDRFFKRGVISSKKDYADVLKWLETAKPGDAAVVDMDPEQWKEKDEKGQLVPIEKAETKFAYTLRRLFEMRKLEITAYQSGPMQVTIRKATALDKQRHGGRKKKTK